MEGAVGGCCVALSPQSVSGSTVGLKVGNAWFIVYSVVNRSVSEPLS
jgi:hypothetical protein